jgi:hypothetical protein
LRIASAEINRNISCSFCSIFPTQQRSTFNLNEKKFQPHTLIMIFLPVYREPSAPELFIHNKASWFNEHFSQAFHKTALEYWLLHPHGQTYTLSMTTIIGALIWLLSLRTSVDKSVQAEDLDGAEGEVIVRDHEENTHGSTPLDSDNQTSSLKDTPTMRKLAPPGHRPTNAQLGGPSARVTQPLSHFTEPGHQTPFAYPKLPMQHTASNAVQSKIPKRPYSPSFSYLAKTAPETYQTLQETGMLNADGTPNKWTNPKNSGNYAELARLAPVGFSTLQSTGRPGPDGTLTKKREIEIKAEGERKEAEVVTYWSNELGNKNGRAMLRKELDEEDLA